MLPVLILGILGAATLAEREGRPPSEPEIDPLKLLGLTPKLTPLEIELGKALGLVPWTPEQITSFHRGILMCPRGHTREFTWLELDILGWPVASPKVEKGKLQMEAESSGHDFEHSRAWIICEDCTFQFWAPKEFMESKWL